MAGKTTSPGDTAPGCAGGGIAVDDSTGAADEPLSAASTFPVVDPIPEPVGPV
jgi:hypothetical protein